MSNPDLEPLVAEIRALSPEEVVHLYLKLVQTDRDRAQLAALALRDKARADEIPVALIPRLEECLAVAPDDRSTVHLAKALAAFGRAAQLAASTLAERIAQIHVTDDLTYWNLDGSVFALGYLGGGPAFELLSRLETEEPSRVLRAKSLYQGQMTEPQRKSRWKETLRGVRALLESDDPGTWREKKTTLTAQKAKAPAKKTPFSIR